MNHAKRNAIAVTIAESHIGPRPAKPSQEAPVTRYMRMALEQAVIDALEVSDDMILQELQVPDDGSTALEWCAELRFQRQFTDDGPFIPPGNYRIRVERLP